MVHTAQDRHRRWCTGRAQQLRDRMPGMQWFKRAIAGQREKKHFLSPKRAAIIENSRQQLVEREAFMEWPDDMIYMVWSKGAVVEGFEPVLWRKDDYGAWIARLRYGDHQSKYGWEIKRISSNGPDTVPNLRPLQWQNCLENDDGKIMYRVTAEGAKNISKTIGLS